MSRAPSGATPTVSTTLGGGEGISHGEPSRREIRSENHSRPDQNGASSNKRQLVIIIPYCSF